jgi:mRNA interferase RelE/StbE
MAWSVELGERAERQLSKLDPRISKRIVAFLYQRLSRLEDPGSIGEALHGSEMGALWKYRVGDYRLIAEIQDNRLIVVVLRVGHHREVYR